MIEPSSTIPLVLKYAESRADKSTDIDLLYVRTSSYLPAQVEEVSKDIKEICDRTDSKDIIKNTKLFKIVKYAKRISKTMHNNYWNKLTTDLQTLSPYQPNFEHTLSELCHGYAIGVDHAMNSFGKRCENFESTARSLVLNEIKYGVSRHQPALIARYASFIISFSNDRDSTRWGVLPEYLTRRIEEQSAQFGIYDVSCIANGLNNCYKFGFPKE